MGVKGAIGGGIAEELFGLKDIDVESILSKYMEPHLYDLAMEE